MICTVLSSTAFKLVPLFALPIVTKKVRAESVVFCQVLFSITVLKLVLLTEQRSLGVDTGRLHAIFILDLFCTTASVLLIRDCLCVPSKLTAAVDFLCPVTMALVLFFIFGRQLSTIAIATALLSILNITLLDLTSSRKDFRAINLIYMVIAVFACSACVINVGGSYTSSLNDLRLDFCILLFAALFFNVGVLMGKNLRPVIHIDSLTSLLLLNFVPAILSGIFLVLTLGHASDTAISLFKYVRPLATLLINYFIFNRRVNTIRVLNMKVVVLTILVIIFGAHDSK